VSGETSEARVLYLIGGAPRCGKTTVAARLAARRGCSRVPADYLGTAFTNYIPEGELPHRYPAWGTATVDERFERYAAREVIANYRTKAATCWPGVRDFLSYAAYDRHAMVVEGYHIEPAFVRQFAADHAQFPVRALFLHRSDAEQLEGDLRRSRDPEDWVLRSATRPETFRRVAEMVVAYSAFIEAEARACGLMSFSMDGPFEERVEQAVGLLLAAEAEE
jgi:2-phosphoglycerate kinase